MPPWLTHGHTDSQLLTGYTISSASTANECKQEMRQAIVSHCTQGPAAFCCRWPVAGRLQLQQLWWRHTEVWLVIINFSQSC